MQSLEQIGIGLWILPKIAREIALLHLYVLSARDEWSRAFKIASTRSFGSCEHETLGETVCEHIQQFTARVHLFKWSRE